MDPEAQVFQKRALPMTDLGVSQVDHPEKAPAANELPGLDKNTPVGLRG
jgi:hypothetical protein